MLSFLGGSATPSIFLLPRALFVAWEVMKSPIDVLSLYAPHNGTLPSLLASRAGARPDTLFLTFQGRRWTWAEFADAVESAARAIAGRGLGRGDRLAVTAANCDRYVILFFALARLGAVLVPVNPGLRPSEARYILEHAEPAAAACAADTIDLLTEAVAGMPRKPWLMLIEGQDDRVPSLEQLLSESPSTAAGATSPQAADGKNSGQRPAPQDHHLAQTKLGRPTTVVSLRQDRMTVVHAAVALSAAKWG